ncbi:hypothetical protein QN277_001212 [Acacia crassicarpa]|uniref:Uncharacterized protein n=1 Tax=Acacia crassicarpa TaxID=499986 RepID=A0AAE1N7T0_9FABA|nr:hypothetical protein QN277_001212 [Acacia crassicarpa]
MGSALEIGIRMRNMLTSLTRACYRFVCCHPCLVCFLGFLIILCRRFPFMVSILVYMSPVLVCTGVLLGTLLYLGQFNSAEVQKEKKFTENISSFQKGFLESGTVIARRYGYKSITEESSIEEASLVKDRVNKAHHNDGLVSLNVPVVGKNSMNIQHEKQEKEEMEREGHEEKLKYKGVPRNIEAIQEEEEEEEEERESSDLGSDDIESSSPDSSMADIIPVIDELHPLLEMEGQQTAPSSRGGYGVEYEKSLKSDDGSVESDEGADYEEDEAEESGIEDESKSAIRWTEEDQKSLMDLGSLELERNQRLENIIARRRAWMQMTEKNLIDLESTEAPSNVPPIVTRRNPFDLSDDIPGSAPSILQPWKNPFDIPFDPNEEKPVPKGDNPKEELPVFNQKETFFSRHESFSLGPSGFRMAKHERPDVYWKPVFVSDQMASEGTSYSSYQQSEVSDSKLSSIPESESVSSTDQEERMFDEQDLPQEAESISTIDHVIAHDESGSQSSSEVDSMEITPAKQRNVHREEFEIVLGEVSDSKYSSVPESESGSSTDQEERMFNEKDLPQEGESMSTIDHVTGRVECGSQSSGEVDSTEVIPAKQKNVHREEEEIVLGGVENNSETELYYETGEATIHEEFNTVETHLRREVADEGSSSKSSQTSLSEVIDDIPDAKESRIMTPASEEDSDLQFESEEEEHQHKEPVYDSSPPTARKLQSFYSIYFDSTTDILERTSRPASVEKAANVKDEKSELRGQRENDDTCDHLEDHSASSQSHTDQDDGELHQYLDKDGSITSNCQHVQPEEKPPSDKENNLSTSDDSFAASSINDHNKNQDVGTPNNDGAGEFYDAMNIFDASQSPEFKSPDGGSPRDVKREEAEPGGIPVLEVRSAKDIDLAFKQLQEGADVEEVILPSMIKDQLAREKSEEGNSEANSSDLKVIEARSLGDIDVAFELSSEVNKGKLSKSSDLKDGIVEGGEANEVEE